MAGAGGVGKAIGFGLAGFGARELRIFDADAARSTVLQVMLNFSWLRTHINSVIRLTITKFVFLELIYLAMQSAITH